MNNLEQELINKVSKISKHNNVNAETAMGICVLTIRLGAVNKMLEYIEKNPLASTDDLFALIEEISDKADEISDFEIVEQ